MIADVQEVRVETGIPVPYIKGTYRQILSGMKIGQSFVVPSLSHRLSALMAAKRNGMRATSQKLNGDGYRVWKIGKLKRGKRRA